MANVSKPSETVWSMQHEYPHRVVLNDITFSKWLFIDTWCHNEELFYTTSYIDWDGIMDTWWTFKHEEDAALFKLTWLG